MGGADPLNLYEHMLDHPGAAMDMIVERPRDVVEREPNLSFSREVLDQLHDQMLAWVGSRLTRHWLKTRQPVRRLAVTVTVSTIGPLETRVEPDLPPLQMTATILPDGSYRIDALERKADGNH